MQKVRLEIAVDNEHAVLGAAEGGAERIELCASLADGGLTPSHGFIEWALRAVSIPVHCIVRPRGGNFHYSPAEIDIMARDIRAMRALGAPGVVAGALTASRAIDVEAVKTLREAADGMRFCFHRAFDLAVDRQQALEDIIACGADILLTSGGATSLKAGAAEVARIVEQARGRIEIMGGAGVTVKAAGELWRTLPIDTLHASLRSPWTAGAHSGERKASMGARDEETMYSVEPEDVRAVMKQLEPRALAVR